MSIGINECIRHEARSLRLDRKGLDTRWLITLRIPESKSQTGPRTCFQLAMQLAVQAPRGMNPVREFGVIVSRKYHRGIYETKS